MNEFIEQGSVRAVGDLVDRMFNSIHIHIAYLDPQFNFIRVNRKYAAADNRQPEFFVGKNHFALYPNPENEAIFREVVATGRPYFVYEKPFAYAEHPERGVSYWDWSLEPVFGDDGVIEGLVLSLINVTDRVRARAEVRASMERLRRSEANLQEAQRIASIGNWDWDIARDTLRWSDEIYRIFGLAPQQFAATYEAFLDTIHPDDRASVVAAVDAALRGEAPYGVDHRIVRPDGALRFVHERAEVTFDEAHKPVRMIGTVQDITERKLGELALRKVNRALRTLSRCNQTLIHAREEGELLRDMCRVIVEDGGYKAAWVGYVRRVDGRAEFGPVAQWGIDAADLARSLEPHVASHPVLDTARSGKTSIVRDILSNPALSAAHAEARKYGYRSVVGLPLTWDGKTPSGVLTICAAERHAFDDDEVALLQELADDLCYGIAALRTRKEREEATRRLQESMERTVQAVASTIEMRDPYTAGHQRRVAQLATAIAHEMGVPEEEVVAMRMASTLHDIGKIYVPAEILNRPGLLNDLERTLVKTHAQVGYNILSGVEFPWPVADMVRQHHERLDGSGYPQGLKGDEILLGARILAVADVVEAMASHRPYRPGRGLDDALEEITRHRGEQYDAVVVDACVKLFREKRFSLEPIGIVGVQESAHQA